MKPHTHRNRGQEGVVLKLLLAGLAAFTCVMVAAGVALAKSVKPDGTLPELSTDILDSLGVSTCTEVEVRVPTLLFTTARIASRFVDVEREVKSGLRVVRSAQVGVYELEREPGRKSVIEMMRAADQRMAELGWDRIVQVVDDQETVLVYGAPTGNHVDEMAACAVVLAEHELVIITARGRLEPIVDLACRELRKGKLDW